MAVNGNREYQTKVLPGFRDNALSFQFSGHQVNDVAVYGLGNGRLQRFASVPF